MHSSTYLQPKENLPSAPFRPFKFSHCDLQCDDGANEQPGGGGGGGKDSLKAMQVPDFSSSVSSLEYSVTGTHCMDYATFHRT